MAAPCWRWRGCRTRIFSPDAEYGRLASAYQFLRHLEHRLQFEDDLQTHTLPSETGRTRAAGPAHAGRRVRGLADARAARAFQPRDGNLQRVVRTQTPVEAPLRYDGSRRRRLLTRAAHDRATWCWRWTGAPRRWRRPWAARICKSGYRAFEHFLERLSGDPFRLDLLNANSDLARTYAGLVRAQPLFRRGADSHAGAGGRHPALANPLGAGKPGARRTA